MWQPPACPIRAAETEDGSRSFSEGKALVPSAGGGGGGSGGGGERVVDSERAEREERARARERDKDGRGRVLDGQLSARQLDELHDMLRKLTVERASVAKGMMFCLDHCEAAVRLASPAAAAVQVSSAAHRLMASSPLHSALNVTAILNGRWLPFPGRDHPGTLRGDDTAGCRELCREEGRSALSLLRRPSQLVCSIPKDRSAPTPALAPTAACCMCASCAAWAAFAS